MCAVSISSFLFLHLVYSWSYLAKSSFSCAFLVLDFITQTKSKDVTFCDFLPDSYVCFPCEWTLTKEIIIITPFISAVLSFWTVRRPVHKYSLPELKHFSSNWVQSNFEFCFSAQIIYLKLLRGFLHFT